MSDYTENFHSLVSFWNKVFALTEEKKNQEIHPDDWKKSAPSAKLYDAAASLGRCKKVLDYGCGSGWAGIIAAKNGWDDVLCVDVHESGRDQAAYHASIYNVSAQVKAEAVDETWLSKQPDGIYDGLICSNVLDVIPTEIAEGIIREAARVVTADASVIFSLNYYMTPEKAASRNYDLREGNMVFIDGTLRLVTRTDEEWQAMFEKYFTVTKLDHFAWPNEETETRRLFYLKKK